MRAKNVLWLPLSAALAMALGFGCAGTSQTAAPAKLQAAAETAADWKFHDIVPVEFVKPYAKIPIAEDVMIIDSRPKQVKYDKGHIPTAVSIPDSQFDKLKDRLPQNKNALLIFYCGGLKCKLSHKSARKAEALGYTNVKVFAEGFPTWMQDPENFAWVSAAWIKKQIDGKADMVLVDSRPKRKKYDKGHIPTAISISDSQFDKLKNQLPQDKSKILVFYCGGFKCKLSQKSAHKAKALGYTNVKVFAAGYPAWKKLAGAVAAKPAAVQIKSGGEEGTIDKNAFIKLMKEAPESVLLIDVRDADEYQTGTLKSAVNVPVDELERKIQTLPADKPIVFICGTGARSGESYYMVKDLRPELKEVYYLEAELTINKDGSFKVE